jgi:hypothetical protein
MSDRHMSERRRHPLSGATGPAGDPDDARAAGGAAGAPPVERLTAAGAAWLASASAFPRSVYALWSARPERPTVLPCGTAFDVIGLPVVFGRRVLERLWQAGPGSGPVAVARGHLLLLSRPGTAQRLPALLRWEEWRSAVPPLICLGNGDTVTLPPPYPSAPPTAPDTPRWLVAPDSRHPHLPAPAALLWSLLHTARHP